MAKTLRTSGDYTIKAGDGWNSGSGVNAITLDSLNVSVSGNLTVGGSSTTVNTTNTTIEDNIIELNSGLSQSLNDSGIIIERGSTGDNAAIVWDESGDIFKLGTTTSTGADKSGGITVTAGALEVAAFTATTGTFSGAITSVGGTVAGSLTAGSLTTNVISANGSNAELSIQPSGTGDVLISALRINGTTLDSSDSTKVTIAEAVDITGALTISSNFVHGSTTITEAEIGLIDGLTAGTVVASKALTVDGSRDVATIRNITSDGTITTSGAATFTGGVTTGALTTNSITSNGSNADLSLQPSGTGDVVISALRINGTTLDSSDSTKVTIAEAVDITGATTIGGAVTLSSSLDFGSAIISNGTVTHSGSSGQQPLDEFVHATYRSAKYIVSITDATNTKYEMVELYITHDGTNAYITSQGVKSTSAGTLAVFAADISGSNVRVLILPSSSESVTYKFLRTLVVV